jgi:tripartite-type tricarboxylate transporter receptor subunit TctC
MLADYLTKDMGQAVVVDNKAGANGIPAAQALAKEKPDGYTVMLGLVSQISFNQHLYKNVNYNAFKDFTFINPVVETPYVLVTSKGSGITDMAGFLAKVKAADGNFDYASAGAGNMTHLAMALLLSKTGLKATHIPYKGSGPAMMSVVSSETGAMVSVVGAALPQIKGGNVNAVAILGPSRAPQIPTVPTAQELKLDIPTIPGWYGLVGPAQMPADVRDRIATSVQRFLADTTVQKSLADLFLFPVKGNGAALLGRAEEESKVWGDFIRANNIQPD